MIAIVYDEDLMKTVNFGMTLSPNRIVNRHSMMFEVSISRCCQWQHQWALFLTSSSVYSLPFHLFEVNLFWQVWSSYLPDQNWQAEFWFVGMKFIPTFWLLIHQPLSQRSRSSRQLQCCALSAPLQRSLLKHYNLWINFEAFMTDDVVAQTQVFELLSTHQH